MDDLPVLAYLAAGLVVALLVVAPAVLAGRRLGAARALPALGVSLALSGVAGLAAPYVELRYLLPVLCLPLLAWSAWIWMAGESWAVFAGRITGGTIGAPVMVLLLCTAIPFGHLEWAARALTHPGLVEYHRPLQTHIPYGVEDWRDFHATRDRLRQQDPVLLWRPRNGAGPYNGQGFKSSPLMAVPKPAGVYRIMAYGDSNTDGVDEIDWPRKLGEQLAPYATPERDFEVINAGVTGYSSYQGLQRFLMEAPIYEPDLVIVSFGWNDAADAIEQPDKHYQVKSRAALGIAKVLSSYRFYLILQHQAILRRTPIIRDTIQPRVAVDDYVANLERLRTEAAARGIETVFLTRPHRMATVKLRNVEGWRRTVPDYNDALRRFTRRTGTAGVDVQRNFSHSAMRHYFTDECHTYTHEGMEALAAMVLARLQAMGVVAAD